jgi:outer membrane protein assembly factor BamA
VLTKGERFKIKGTYSTNKYEYFYIRYNLPHWAGYKYDVNFLARYHWQPRKRFFGIGALTDEADEVNYAHRETHFHIDASYYPIKTLGFGLFLEHTISKIRDGEDPNLQGDLDSLIADPLLSLTPASFAESRMAGIGFTINHDWRNHRGQPTKGGFERLDVAYNIGTGRGDDIEYWSFRAEAAQYFDIYMKRVIAFRGLLDWRDRVNNSPALPVYQLADLGGLHGLRGFPPNRFHDHAMALGAVEYRWPVWDVVDAFLFVEGGKVFEDLSDDFEFKHWEMSYGGGLRLWHREGLRAYLQVAGSNEGARVYFSWSEDLDF